MLSHGSDSITAIALQLGYTDPNYFSRCFSMETGMSPAVYRKTRASEDISGIP